MKFLLVTLLTLSSSLLQAEVVQADERFFHIKIVREVSVTASDAYDQFIKIGEWWSSDHTWFGKASNMTIVEKAGDCFCEREGKREVLHMLISYVDPGKEIRMLGGLGPLQMMGLDGAMSWKFEDKTTGGSIITQEYRVNGGGQKDLPQLAAIVDKVQTLQTNLLVEKLAQQ